MTEAHEDSETEGTMPSRGQIVVGVDGSKSSLDALEWAADQADLTGAKLEVIVAWEWPTGYGWTLPFPEGWDPAADARAVADAPVKRVREGHPDLAVDVTVTEGHPAPLLVEASRGADLLVVGSRGHGEFPGMLLGSVSEHCVTNAHCPVLVFRGD